MGDGKREMGERVGENEREMGERDGENEREGGIWLRETMRDNERECVKRMCGMRVLKECNRNGRAVPLPLETVFSR
jgi:hypothetical protein